MLRWFPIEKKMSGKTWKFGAQSGLLGHTYDVLYLLLYILILISGFYIGRVSELKAK